MTLHLIYSMGTLSSPSQKKKNSMNIEGNSSLISLQSKKPFCSLKANQKRNSQQLGSVEVGENTPAPGCRQELFPLLENTRNGKVNQTSCGCASRPTQIKAMALAGQATMAAAETKPQSLGYFLWMEGSHSTGVSHRGWGWRQGSQKTFC